MMAECYTFEKGQKSDNVVLFLRDDEALRSGLVSKFEIEAHVHLSSGESFETSIPILVKKELTFADVLFALEQSTMSSFEIFSSGKSVSKDELVHKVIVTGSKLLLYSIGSGGSSKPKGLRWWCRFPKHVTEGDYHGTGYSNHYLAFRAEKSDVDIYGIGLYKLAYDDRSNFDIRDMVFRVYDEKDDPEKMVSSRDFPRFELDNNLLKFDNNKICKYNFVEEKGLEPVRVKKGQHLHIIITYYVPSVSEKFFFGTNGEDFAKVKNTDMGAFTVKTSHIGSNTTTVDYGQLPGLLFKFV